MTAATVITPLLHGSRAIQLANGTWRKRLLPVGDVEYQGRTLHFTPAYLRGLVEAWDDRAYDQVPLQFADASNKHTNDPERTRGWITDMTLGDDGLYIEAELTDRGEQVLQDNPYLGVSARIVEQYQRSDGKFYPAAVQHVLGTLDPRVPGLGEWERLDMSNDGGLVVDLSHSTWAGEPSAVELAGDDQLTEQELNDLIEAISEVELEDAGVDDGLDEFDAAFQANWAAEQAREQARQLADMDDLTRPARSDEDIVARAISRASAGVYDTSRAASFASPSGEAIELATTATVAANAGLCGAPDPFGRCSSRYHDLLCIHGIGTDWQASEPPRDTYEAALSNWASEHDLGGTPAAYGDGEDAYPIPQGTLELAHALNQSWGMHGDTFFGPVRLRQDPYAALAIEAGRPDLAGEQPQFRDYPDTTELRARLGL